MPTIPMHELGGKQFMKARTLFMPVVIIDQRTFRLPSASNNEGEHTVQFDFADSPSGCSCTCVAGAHGTACWAMARALEVLTLLSINKIYIGVGELPQPAPRPARAPEHQPDDGLCGRLKADGEMLLLTPAALKTESACVVSG